MTRWFYILSLLVSLPSFSQEIKNLKSDSITWQSVYDKPEKIRRFFFGLQPVYADAFANGVNAGFGADAYYFPKSGKFDLRMAFRRPYFSRSSDFMLDKMKKYSSTLNEPVGFLFFEMSGSVTLKNQVKNIPVKIAVSRKSENSSSINWVESKLVSIPSKLRTIQTARLGFQAWRSAVDVNRLLEKQGSRNADVALPEQLIDVDGNVEPFYAFSNLYNQTLFAGYGLTHIRNHSSLIDGFETAIQDKIITYYGDLMYAPTLRIEDAVYGLSTYSLQKIKLNSLGFRVGMEMRHNRKRSWGFAAETGWRPAPKGNAGYLLVRLSVPVFAGYLIKRD